MISSRVVGAKMLTYLEFNMFQDANGKRQFQSYGSNEFDTLIGGSGSDNIRVRQLPSQV